MKVEKERDQRWLDLEVKVKKGQRLTVVRFVSESESEKRTET